MWICREPRGHLQATGRGKSGRTQELLLDDRRLARIIRRCQQLPGQQLFRYFDDDGNRPPIDSGMVND